MLSRTEAAEQLLALPDVQSVNINGTEASVLCCAAHGTATSLVAVTCRPSLEP